jgi:hypothetical protein
MKKARGSYIREAEAKIAEAAPKLVKCLRAFMTAYVKDAANTPVDLRCLVQDMRRALDANVGKDRFQALFPKKDLQKELSRIGPSDQEFGWEACPLKMTHTHNSLHGYQLLNKRPVEIGSPFEAAIEYWPSTVGDEC